jgi:hypothetical protein
MANISLMVPFSLFYWYFIQTYQKAACDGQTINLDCPSGTKIAIQLVQYGRSAPSSEVLLIYTDYNIDELIV